MNKSMPAPNSGTRPPPRHFLDLDRFDTATLRRILDMAKRLKVAQPVFGDPRPLQGRTLALIFEKPSTRTRVSFEVGMQQLGGTVVTLSDNESQLGRGETIADTARVLSRYVDAIMIRTDDPAKLAELSAHASVPVINGLTDRTHPCQIMADLMVLEEHKGELGRQTVAWVGDGNNVAATWIQAAALFGMPFRLACPPGLEPDAGIVAWARDRGGDISIGHDAAQAVAGADCVITDTWVSMGDTDADARRTKLEPFRVDDGLMARAAEGAVFMHCLPAHRGEEVTDAVIDGPASIVWDEAENRMHVQKAILGWCLLQETS